METVTVELSMVREGECVYVCMENMYYCSVWRTCITVEG